MEDQTQVEAFRLRYRVAALEQLVLKTAFFAPVLARRLSAEESRQVLIDGLKISSQEADRAYGAVFQDPALGLMHEDPVALNVVAR